MLIMEHGPMHVEPSHVLIMGKNSEITGGGPSAYIQGTIMRKGNRRCVFPMGNNGLYMPLAYDEGLDENDEMKILLRKDHPPSDTRNGNFSLAPAMGFWEIQMTSARQTLQFRMPEKPHGWKHASIELASHHGNQWVLCEKAGYNNFLAEVEDIDILSPAISCDTKVSIHDPEYRIKQSGEAITSEATPGFRQYVFTINGNESFHGAGNVFTYDKYKNGDILQVSATDEAGCLASATLRIPVIDFVRIETFGMDTLTGEEDTLFLDVSGPGFYQKFRAGESQTLQLPFSLDEAEYSLRFFSDSTDTTRFLFRFTKGKLIQGIFQHSEGGFMNADPSIYDMDEHAIRFYSGNSMHSEIPILPCMPSLKDGMIMTPDDDGYHDMLSIQCDEVPENIHWSVKDIDGNILFESSSVIDVWTGRDMLGNKVKAGPYFYQIHSDRHSARNLFFVE
jgi:hypothetical protein